jgi:hypothetical protein
MTAAAAETAVLVFARAPVPGEAKTRLIPALGAAGAASLAARFVRRSLRTAVAAGVGPVELACSPDAQQPFFVQCQRDFGVGATPQQGRDLGERMAEAARRHLAHRPVLLVGTDIPPLTPAHLRTAAAALATNDAVVIPAEDGGYVLLGLARWSPRLFERLPWGSAEVMASTRERLRELGWRWRELPALWDVDRPEDLARLAALGEDHAEDPLLPAP